MPVTFPPRRPTGTSAEARFQQWVWDAIMSMRVQDGPDAITQRTTRGTISIPKGKKGGGSGTLNYRGDWIAGQNYKKGDIVRKRTGAGGTTGATGLFICVKDTANSVTDSAPELPEPEDTAQPGAVTYWHCWAVGLIQTSACRGGAVKLMWINMQVKG